MNSTNTLNVYGYNAGFVDHEPSYAAALQIALLVLVIGIAGAFTWFRQRGAR